MSSYLDAPSTWSAFLRQLPLREWGFSNCPAVPYWADEHGDPNLEHIGLALANLGARGSVQTENANKGLSTNYTIGKQTKSAYEFLYNEPLPPAPPVGNPPPEQLPLKLGDDFKLPWTLYQGMYTDSQDIVRPFAETLTDGDKATAAFWPTIAQFGLPYNLLVLAKVDAARAPLLQAQLGRVWADLKMSTLQAKGLLYEIDMSILASLAPYTALDKSVRFTPGTVTVLRQDPKTKALTPIAITVSTNDGVPPRVYTADADAWLYALQAAKTSITVWGIWLGHVYHWHIVTAAMQMTMYNNLPAGHKLYELLQPQSQSLIDFDFALLSILWGQISPPTPVPGYLELLTLLDRFAVNRSFFDDDPQSELATRGLDVSDFTVKTPWDMYPVVGYLLDIWDITSTYVTAVVGDMYTSDDTVSQDGGLKKWMAASVDPTIGNIRGLPTHIETREMLSDVLTSILYRVTAHGPGSLNPSVNPGLSFIANFPPCLQSAHIPDPGDTLTKEELLAFLPHTGTIGGMTTFYFTFVYSQPQQRLIPTGGPGSAPYFPNNPVCQKALIAYRTSIQTFITDYTNDWNAALARIRGTAPGQVPVWAQNQAGQWALSIEI